MEAAVWLSLPVSPNRALHPSPHREESCSLRSHAPLRLPLARASRLPPLPHWHSGGAVCVEGRERESFSGCLPALPPLAPLSLLLPRGRSRTDAPVPLRFRCTLREDEGTPLTRQPARAQPRYVPVSLAPRLPREPSALVFFGRAPLA